MIENYSFEYQNNNIVDCIFRALNSYKNLDKVALKTSKNSLKYHELTNRVFSLAWRIKEIQPRNIGVLGAASVDVFEFILSSLVNKITYVPLNPSFKENHNAYVIKHSDCDLLIVCKGQEQYAQRMLLASIDSDRLSNLNILCSKSCWESLFSDISSIDSAPEFLNLCENSKDLLDSLKLKIEEHSKILLSLQEQGKVHFLDEREVFSEQELDTELESIIQKQANLFVEQYDSNKIDLTHTMHILYTSGTTGEPKGVMVSYGNYSAYFNKLLKVYDFRDDDVFCNISPLTFDISVQDLLFAIYKGATVVAPNDFEILNLVKCFEKNNVTVVNIVASNASFIERFNLMKDKTNTTLRITTFVGEALWYKQVVLWHKWFPNSQIINFYGPTEATVGVFYYELKEEHFKAWNSLLSESPSLDNKIVCLGHPMPDVKFMVLDEDMLPVNSNEVGMLYLGGNQLTKGYLNNPTKNAECFIEFNGEHWYKTGDMVKISLDVFTNKEVLSYVGRSDDMVKLNGFRISLNEIDEEFSSLHSHRVLSLVYENPKNHSKYVFAVVENSDEQMVIDVLSNAKNQVPKYIQPLRVFKCDAFPRNVNGKVDRKKILAMYQDQALAVLS